MKKVFSSSSDYIRTGRMKAKFVFESIGDILKPKDPIYIKNLKTYRLNVLQGLIDKFHEIKGNLSWNDIDIQSLFHHNIHTITDNFEQNIPIEQTVKEILGLFESIDDIFKPKDEDELKKKIEERWPIDSREEATRILKASIHRNNKPMFFYALDHDADALDDLSSGALWLAFNEWDDEEIILLLIKKAHQWLLRHKDVRVAALSKAINFGLVKVYEWLIKKYDYSKKELSLSLHSSFMDFVNEPNEVLVNMTYKYMDK